MLNNIARFAASCLVSFVTFYGGSVSENWGIYVVCDWGITISV